ncbi:murein hydrolase activator EnvC family protein [Desulfolutivibrio sulfoxidireducens]|uniref:murein hydrolase activator EnvC family protein n=1 Tax=Desulfolutivibrio sulfoxidireducens TaxID=2773299 RepID=UPI00159DCE09|nr:peptidoglycan DD-metalloendopeptidase family protein [Desulfolutivibrio sulfoxidireducens]QLA15832.1 peptidoglycan DD-metalloendopeptidase family protein [Desulfolutivibrio sulfoxidireducens]QLA20266.1 peptidoglycan DD-metalloendopeptidase family protein [Desulfolutivibrio sulfoxidireducens]
MLLAATILVATGVSPAPAQTLRPVAQDMPAPSDSPAPAIPPELESELARQKETASKRQQNVERLTAEERSLNAGLSALEAKVGKLTGQLEEKESLVREIMAEEARLSREHAHLAGRQENARNRMSELVAALWPVHLGNLESKAAGLSSWDEADRRFTWLADMYGAAAASYAAYREQSSRLAANMAAQEAARARLVTARAEAEKSKDALLAEQLEFSKQLRNVRRRIVSEEEQLKEILRAIEDLDARLAAPPEPAAPVMRGSMTWPVAGTPVTSFDPSADPPRRGVGFSTSPNATVKSVGPGKVVFADVLRGMGKVIIVSHGDGHFTVYAYLSSISVSMGREVGGNEPVGAAGHYPPAGGPGMYFELRFHEKAINPGEWLAVRE